MRPSERVSSPPLFAASRRDTALASRSKPWRGVRVQGTTAQDPSRRFSVPVSRLLPQHQLSVSWLPSLTGHGPPVALSHPRRHSVPPPTWPQAKPPGLRQSMLPAITVAHSVAPYPSRKWVQGALNSFSLQKPPAPPKLSGVEESVRFRGPRETQTSSEQQQAHEAYGRCTDSALERDAYARLREKVRRRWTADELEDLILQKIEGRTSGNGVVFQAFRLFSTEQGEEITPSVFRDALNRLLMCGLSEEECRPLFERYDTDGGGTIEVNEFLEGLMRPYGGPTTLMGNTQDCIVANERRREGGTRFLGGGTPPVCRPPPKSRFPAGITGVIRNSPSSPIAPWPDPAFESERWNRHPNAHLLGPRRYHHGDENRLRSTDLPSNTHRRATPTYGIPASYHERVKFPFTSV